MMTIRKIWFASLLYFTVSSFVLAQVEPKPNASIEILEKSALQFFDPSSKVEVLSKGYAWTEGPIWVEELQVLLFSDIPNNTVYQVDSNGTAREYLQPSGYTGLEPRGGELGSNGLLLDPTGYLVLLQHGDRQVVRMDASLSDPHPTFESLADSYRGKKFNSPNDGVYDKAGNLYFTDPPYGLEGNVNDPAKELSFQGIYCLKNNGDLILIDSLSRPNGVALSPDEDKLLVSNSDAQLAAWFEYELTDVARVKSKKMFHDITHLIGKSGYQGLPDGMKMHSSGTLFASGPGGIWVFDTTGKPIAQIKTGEATSNCAFSADEKTLFLTADHYILKVNLK